MINFTKKTAIKKVFKKNDEFVISEKNGISVIINSKEKIKNFLTRRAAQKFIDSKIGKSPIIRDSQTTDEDFDSPVRKEKIKKK
jgi:hypothetical protein